MAIQARRKNKNKTKKKENKKKKEKVEKTVEKRDDTHDYSDRNWVCWIKKVLVGEKKDARALNLTSFFFCSTLNVFRYGVLDGSLERTVREAARYTLKSKEKKICLLRYTTLFQSL